MAAGRQYQSDTIDGEIGDREQFRLCEIAFPFSVTLR
jgi:hypothetical protein